MAMVFPFIWMIGLWLKPEAEIYAPSPRLLPRAWDFANYTEALTTGRVGMLLLNGALVTLGILVRSFEHATPPLGISLFASGEGGHEVGPMMAAATLIVAPLMSPFFSRAAGSSRA